MNKIIEELRSKGVLEYWIAIVVVWTVCIGYITYLKLDEHGIITWLLEFLNM